MFKTLSRKVREMLEICSRADRVTHSREGELNACEWQPFPTAICVSPMRVPGYPPTTISPRWQTAGSDRYNLRRQFVGRSCLRRAPKTDRFRAAK